MRDATLRRAALIGGLSLATLAGAGSSDALAWRRDGEFWWGPPRPFLRSFVDRPRKKAFRPRPSEPQAAVPTVPPGLLHIVVSLDRQRATLFVDGAPFATSTISSGTASHPTPRGVFSVIQKRRHHVSNLYGAPMPYMQRLTWSGTALHEGPLPGRPASHGCIRLTKDFAQLLWKATRIGARVIVTGDEVAPVAIESPRLFAPGPKMADAKGAGASHLIKTAEAANVQTMNIVADATRPVAAQPRANAPAEAQSTKLTGADGVTEPPLSSSATPRAEASQIVVDRMAPSAAPDALAAKQEPKRHDRVVSVFISRKDAKLYVRQDMEPLFETPVSILRPEQPLGTHVFTAMGERRDGQGLRWTVISIPSSSRPANNSPRDEGARRGSRASAAAQIAFAAPVPDPKAALDRIVVPPAIAARIADLVTPGSSLIVSDNGLSSETGRSTDFIVLTP